MFKLAVLVAALSAVALGNEGELGFRMTERLSNENPIYVNRITGGENGKEGEFPYQASLHYKKSHICGAVIISEKTVLTAAHCVFGQMNQTLFEVVGGIINLKEFGPNVQTSDLQDIFIHPLYPGRVGPNDIAVLILKTPFKWTKYVQKVNLPAAGMAVTGDTMLSGWGSTSRTITPVFPNILQKAKLPIVSYQDCSKYFGTSPLNEKSNICTGPIDGDLSACSGDSGGPLVKETDGKKFVVGLVSWGKIPCGRGSPTVYTQVSSFINFINEHAK